MAITSNPTPDPTTCKPPRRPRWIPISLRMFVAMLCVSAAWTGVRIFRQHVAIRAIERLGGKVVTHPVGPAWLRAGVGMKEMRIFEDVDLVTLDLSNTVTDADLVHLRALPLLTGLDLKGD